jgi:hypothetical protein
MHVRLRTVLLTLPLLAMAACDNGLTTTSTPTSTTTTTETFTGTLTKNSGVTHQFAATSRGVVTATLTKIDPDSAQTIGVSLGTWNGTSCQVIIANDSATVGAQLVGQVSGVGNLCLRVYDVGKLTTSEDYSVDVAHP